MSCLRVRARAAAAAAIVAGCLAVARPVSAQSNQAYLSLGAGATYLSGGTEWLVIGTPVAVGAELGAGNLFVASLAASYQPFARQLQRKVHPFLRVSLTAVSSSPYTAGASVLAVACTGRSRDGSVYALKRQSSGRHFTKTRVLLGETSSLFVDPAGRRHVWLVRYFGPREGLSRGRKGNLRTLRVRHWTDSRDNRGRVAWPAAAAYPRPAQPE